jgi:hypothetical protein
MAVPSILFAYFGPETILPVTSVLATVLGCFLMFGRMSIRLVMRLLFSRGSRSRDRGSLSKPHFRSAERVHSETPQE